MVRHDNVKAEKNAARDHTLSGKPDDFDMDLAIACMKEVGHRDSEGYLVLPEYYEE